MTHERNLKLTLGSFTPIHTPTKTERYATSGKAKFQYTKKVACERCGALSFKASTRKYCRPCSDIVREEQQRANAKRRRQEKMAAKQTVNESSLKLGNWLKAYKIHSRQERMDKNPLWKHKGKIALGMGALAAADIAATGGTGGAIGIASGAGGSLLQPHVADIIRIKRKLDKKQNQAVTENSLGHAIELAIKIKKKRKAMNVKTKEYRPYDDNNFANYIKSLLK